MQVNIAKHDCTIIWDGVYCFALSDYPHISDWELKKLLKFIDYEKAHGRQTEIICEDNGILAAINNAIEHPESVEIASLPVKITECTQCRQHGCLTEYVCHIATPENAKHILTIGKLLSAVRVFNKSGEELVFNERNAAGDPADYFDYIMFAWGNCVGGYRLTMERLLGRSPNEEDESGKNFIPGVSFCFRYEDIIRHPGYVFDGYHPVKIKDELVLSDYLYACIVPEQNKNEFEKLITPEIFGKIYYLSQDGLGLWDWAEKVYEYIKSL